MISGTSQLLQISLLHSIIAVLSNINVTIASISQMLHLAENKRKSTKALSPCMLHFSIDTFLSPSHSNRVVPDKVQDVLLWVLHDTFHFSEWQVACCCQSVILFWVEMAGPRLGAQFKWQVQGFSIVRIWMKPFFQSVSLFSLSVSLFSCLQVGENQFEY